MAWNASAKKVAEVTGAKVSGKTDVHFTAYGTDTRKDLSQKLFIALKGDNFDANDFLEKALEAGAAGLLFDKKLSEEELNALQRENPELCLLQVEDTLESLQQLSTAWRRECGFLVVGITGSNGKTTTKEFLHQILNTQIKAYASQGSLNNHWGVPFTLLDADQDCEVVVCEMGMNSPGEIARLCHIAEPDVVGVTFVGRGHLEGMGSIEKVALEKSQIYLNAPKAKKLFNMDNFYTKTMKEDYWQEGDLCFSKEKGQDIFAKCLNSDFEKMSVEGSLKANEFVANLSVFGEHNVTNLMAAMGFASLCGLSDEQVIKALPSVKMAWGRNQVEKINELTVVFDAYNANPESMDAFLENASKQKLEGKKHLVLGEMLELGAEAASLHEDLGRKAAALGFDSAHFFGPSFKQFATGLESSGKLESSVVSSTYEQSLAIKIKSMLQPNDAVFIKASRGIRLERFLELLKSDT